MSTSRLTVLSVAALAVVVFPTIVFAGEAGGFTPLTQIPGIQSVSSQTGMSAFLNNIYQLCIGAAAVLAVLQIMRGGITYMMGDSITEKKEAKDLIVMSVVGLLLVLSPAIVFGIIDPRILNLNVGFDRLNPGQARVGNNAGDIDPFGPGGIMSSGTWESSDPRAEEECRRQGGTPSTLSGGRIRCDQASAPRSEPFPHGRTSIEMNEVSACDAQDNCEVEPLPRSQYRCLCSGTFTLAEGQVHTAIVTTGLPDHPGCGYVRVASYPDAAACGEGANAINDANIQNSTTLFVCRGGGTATLAANHCSAVGTLSL